MCATCALVVGCPSGTASVESDVPCDTGDAWPGFVDVYIRTEDEGVTPSLLLTASTVEQSTVDLQDGVDGDDPHEAVYRWRSGAEEFELVSSMSWDTATGPVASCYGQGDRPTPFGIGSGQDLSYNDHPVAFSGHIVIRIVGAPTSDVVAVLSTDRPLGGIPFLTGGGSPGQHYHQLFSESTGEALGPALRLGVVGNALGEVGPCWSRDESFLIYIEADASSNATVPGPICVVDVRDEMRTFRRQ